MSQIDRYGISKKNMLFLNRQGYFKRVPWSSFHPPIEINAGHLQVRRSAELFKRSFVVEVVGAGFDKPFDCDSFTLRFPRIHKIHNDRLVKDIVGYDELQILAERAMESSSDCESEEEKL
jgi:DNA ligase-4